jgi:metal-sulfur cluster biosynthetic enzyme
MKQERKKIILEKLKNVIDPELGVSIVDLGLIYDISEQNGIIKIKMTLTTMGCPFFDLLEEQIKNKLKKIKGVKGVIVRLTFDPPWTPDRLSQKAKAALSFLGF